MGKIVKVYTYANYSGAVYKFHLIAKITGSCMEALRIESLSEKGLFNEWVSVSTQGIPD